MSKFQCDRTAGRNCHDRTDQLRDGISPARLSRRGPWPSISGFGSAATRLVSSVTVAKVVVPMIFCPPTLNVVCACKGMHAQPNNVTRANCFRVSLTGFMISNIFMAIGVSCLGIQGTRVSRVVVMVFVSGGIGRSNTPPRNPEKPETSLRSMGLPYQSPTFTHTLASDRSNDHVSRGISKSRLRWWFSGRRHRWCGGRILNRRGAISAKGRGGKGILGRTVEAGRDPPCTIFQSVSVAFCSTRSA